MIDIEMKRPITAYAGPKIRILRDRNGITQHQLAARMRTRGFRWTRTDISKIETGKRILDIDELAYVALALGTNLDTLLPVQTLAELFPT